MKAIFFGSIGTLVETSEIQRKSYNLAFEKVGVDWYWNTATYCNLLSEPGGLKRIRKFANNTLSEDKIKSIHFYKEKFFTELIPGTLYLRPTVIDVIRYAKNNSLKLGFISTTSESNINVIKSAIIDELDFSLFDLITTNKNVEKPKPDPEIYQYALDTLNLAEDEALVIEDTVVNQNCALKAGVKCILFPGEYAEIPISNKYYTLTYNLMSKVEEVLG